MSGRHPIRVIAGHVPLDAARLATQANHSNHMTTGHLVRRQPVSVEANGSPSRRKECRMSTIMDGLSTIDDIDVDGCRVLLRADFDVPLASASPSPALAVADDTRIRAALPTIDELRRRGARLVLVSQLGRSTVCNPRLSMRPVADRLATLTGATVPLAPGVTGPAVRELTEQLAPGAMLMLENLRSAAGETASDPRLASALAELADVYVDDALGSMDRACASTEGVAHLLPGAVGRLMEREILALSAIVDRPARPLVAILGGSSIADDLGLIRRFLELADVVCLGGAICFPFLSVRGRRIGHSPCPGGDLEPAALALASVARSARLALPSDLLVGGSDAPDGHGGFDIGPETADQYAAEIDRAATVFWSGLMGRVELAAFAGGTRAVAEAVASASATSVVAGEETIHALRGYGLQDRVSHLSMGGGATLKLLEGRELPGLEALRGPKETIIQSA
jgi:phosphoglycerate kinase